MSDGRSLFARIRSSFVGMIVGLVLAIGMVAMLFWNEGPRRHHGTFAG